MTTIRSFPPVTGQNPHILILGSMPGEASLKANQYYAHPRNQFWPIICNVLDISVELPYEMRVAAYTQKGLALWDVLYSCKRKGSLDSAIMGEEPSDLSGFLKLYTGITHIIFNGKKAEQSFHRYIKPTKELDYFVMPSTSPANAGQTLEKKKEIWTKTLIPLLTL